MLIHSDYDFSGPGSTVTDNRGDTRHVLSLQQTHVYDDVQALNLSRSHTVIYNERRREGALAEGEVISKIFNADRRRPKPGVRHPRDRGLVK